MRLSIIIICLNEAEHLTRNLGAINSLDHAGLDVEVIVVDSGSEDHSQEIARSLGARVVQCGIGIPLARNVGSRAATGEILAQVDADAELLPGWFENVASHFARTQRLVLGAPPLMPQDASWIARAYHLHWGKLPKEMTGPCQVDNIRLHSTHCLAFGREVFEVVGGFREDLLVTEDSHFIQTAKDLGFPIILDPRFRYLHHGEPKNLAQFYRRILWGASYQTLVDALRQGNYSAAWRPQYVYGAIVGAEAVGLGLSLACPIGGWQLGIPLFLGMLGLSTLLPALQTARRHDVHDKIPALAAMYGAMGLATAASLIGLGKKKTKRWR